MRNRHFSGGPHKAGRKVHHRVSHLADDGEHGFFELGFVYGLARCEPCAVVVAGQVAEEGDTLRAKMGGRRSRNGFRSASHAAGRLAKIAERGGAIGCGKRRSFPSARSFPPIAHPLQPGGPLSHGVCECSGQRRLDRTRGSRRRSRRALRSSRTCLRGPESWWR